MPPYVPLLSLLVHVADTQLKLTLLPHHMSTTTIPAGQGQKTKGESWCVNHMHKEGQKGA